MPLMWGWVLVQAREVQSYPVPTDSPRVRLPGGDPLRVLVFGSGPAVGRGVTSHTLSLPGALARTLSARSGRAIEVDLVSEGWMTAAIASRRLSAMDLSGYDAIVVFVGVDDALTLVSLRRWARSLSAMLSALFSTASPSARAYVVGIQPIRSIPVFDSRLGALADRHAVELNALTEEECARWPRADFVRFREADPAPTLRFRDAPAYLRIAQLLASAMRPQLAGEFAENVVENTDPRGS
ncbi:SGNH/GDSL hydrolase family protein [Lacisediminihabitans profunda]|uniref:SGNH/GDSL hydrolase family protein n=1 Tax=Lacisediminihabitans profunda TaxID=2594790 RepID=A0A5C8UV36_9MICO|nr:SGNH/GDSL hydrolase family protein [Lacisediminihabitans profunda]TXN32398.1 SGNH/GDSL hydrolase family protein [Lacisediminihabitans profunda]